MPGNPDGFESDDDGEFDDEDFEENLTVDMYGTKVLYRPDEYDYDQGSGAEEGQTNNYYGKYAYYIMYNLYRLYGMTDRNTVNGIEDSEGRLPDFNAGEGDYPWNMDMTSYLYDSIRYQVDTIGTFTQYVNVVVENNQIVDIGTEINEFPNTFYFAGADTNVAWNWTLSANPTSGDLDPAYVYSVDNMITQDGRVYTYSLENNSINSYYTDAGRFDASIYEDLYLTTSDNAEEAPNQEEFYSDYVKTLEYVIYCYAVDQEPANVSVTINDDGTYQIKIGNFASIDDALTYAKNIFKILGSYVGLVDRQITKIQNWILENVIGSTALNDADMFTNYTSGVIAYVDQNGEIVGYNFEKASQSTNVLGRDYRTAVRNIIEGVCELVTIGNDNGEDVTIDDRFLASNIMEYAGNMFFIGDDTNFPAPSGDSSISDLKTLLPLEYQSVAIMLNEETYVDGLWVALKYDANLDGTEEGVFGSEYIDIIVDLNYYNHATNTRTVIDSKQVRVYDGPYDLDYIYSEAGDGSDGSVAPEGHCSGVMFDNLGQLHVGKFNVDVGDGILKTDVGSVGNYTSAPYVSQNPLVIVGTTDVRKYYEIVEFGTNPEFDTDVLPDGYTYTSGRFNPEMFSGSDGCDYLEITYKVIKKAGDITTNYKFYTGIAFMDTAEEPYKN